MGKAHRCQRPTEEGEQWQSSWRCSWCSATFLLVAPVIEYGTVESTNIFTAIGNAEGGAGGD